MNNELTLEQLRFARDIGATHRYDDLFWKSALDVKVVAWSNIGEVWKVRDAGIDNSNSAWDEYKINFAPLDDAEQTGQHRVTSDGNELPSYATELQHLISYRNMNAQDGEIFRAIYRKGRASHSDELRDAKKVLFYAKAEVERLERAAQEMGK